MGELIVLILWLNHFDVLAILRYGETSVHGGES